MPVLRKVLLAASTNSWLRTQATRRAFIRRSVSRFMPGESMDDALQASAGLNAEKIGVIATHLGENLASAQEAEGVMQHYLTLLERIRAAGLDVQISIKPTQLGLDFDARLCERNLDRLLARAAELGNFVWIDMESSPYVDPTLALFRNARARSDRVGVALQAYLRRTEQDLESLLPLGPWIRIVKGAYLESPAVAFPQKSDVDENYYRLCCRLLGDEGQRRGAGLHVATHDAALIGRLQRFISERASAGVATAPYEFAMLYGIQRGLQRQLARSGARLRVLISYGEHWFPWYMRRLAERPANVLFVVRNVFG
jgi:proline dehydrogenase